MSKRLGPRMCVRRRLRTATLSARKNARTEVADIEVGRLRRLLHELDQRLAALGLAPSLGQHLRRLLARVARRTILLHVDHVLSLVGHLRIAGNTSSTYFLASSVQGPLR